MSSTILTNWTVYYSSDTGASGGYKQIRWTGAGSPETTTNTVNELYSALMDLFSISSQNDAHDTIPMVAVTPTVYQIGASDAGDLEPWFIDPVSIQHLTGGSIQTVDWTRVEGADANSGNSGIVKVPYTLGTQFISSDIGRTVTHASGDSGTLLYFASNEAWIRPTNSTNTHNWDTGSGVFSATGGTGSVTQNGAPATGERLWSNVYTIGTIENNTRMYVYQNNSQLTSFWDDGHLDRLILVNDGFDAGLIDDGILEIYARQYTKLYDHYTLDVSAGGRNPVPLSTTPDSNNNNTSTTGYRQMIGTGGSGTFNVGNGIYVGSTWATATAKGILTAVSGYTLTYYLVGDLTDFTSGTVKEYVLATGLDGDATCTAATPSAAGIATGNPATITATFGGITRDLNNGNGSRHYSTEIDCQQVALATVYERLKYTTERRETGDIDAGAQSRIGNAYQAVGDLYIPYDTGSIDNPFNENEEVTTTDGFSAIITSKHDRGTNEGFIVVRNARGTTPSDNEQLTGTTSGHTALVDTNSGADPVTTITQTKTAPFGTFAGGKFFGARGVFLTDVPGADANNYVLIDSEGVSQSPAASVPVTVNGVVSGDKVSVFRANDTAGTINRTYLTSHATANTAGLSTFQVDAGTPIPNDTPTSGRIRIRNAAGTIEHHIRYTSWSGTTFTLRTEVTGTITAIEDVTGRIFYDENANLSTVKPGDLVRNTSDGTPGSWAQIILVENTGGDNYRITHTPLTGGTDNEWDVGDVYSIHTLPADYDGTYTAYVPYIDAEAESTSISTSVTYVTDRNISTQVRRKGIIPFTVNTISLTSSGYTATAVRTTDSIVT